MRLIILIVLSCLPLLAKLDDGIVVPDGYVLQVLTATDGRIAMPKNWFYTNTGTPSGWMWTFSAEDPKKTGEYETGLRLQVFFQYEKKTKQPRENFAQRLIAEKRNSIKVIKECPILDFGSFRRQCIEVIENIKQPSGVKPFHILYSVMWLKDMDVIALSTFGSPDSKWESVASISKVMSEFTLIGEHPGNKD